MPRVKAQRALQRALQRAQKTKRRRKTRIRGLKVKLGSFYQVSYSLNVISRTESILLTCA